MMKNQLPSVVYSDSELIKLWKERQKKLKRFDIELPDLSDVINPNSAETKSILNRLINFNKDRGGLSANTLK
nr:integrase [Vibrio anguillarum]